MILSYFSLYTLDFNVFKCTLCTILIINNNANDKKTYVVDDCLARSHMSRKRAQFSSVFISSVAFSARNKSQTTILIPTTHVHKTSTTSMYERLVSAIARGRHRNMIVFVLLSSLSRLVQISDPCP